MPYPNEHAAPLRDVGDFKEQPTWAKKGQKFARKADGTIFGKIKVPATIAVIWGQLKNQTGKQAAAQSLRFPIADWTADAAKAWLKKNNVKYIAFEPAAKPKKKTGDAILPPAESLVEPRFNADPQSFYRATTLRKESVDVENRTAELTFSSEAGVKRWYGMEILLHGKNNVDLSRLNATGAVLMNHDERVIVGPIKSAEVREDRRAHAVIRFDEDPDGDKALLKAASGSLRGVSVRYAIIKAKQVLEDEEYVNEAAGIKLKGPALVATRWQPLEISLTPIPADWHVGIGRDATRSLDGIEFEETEAVSEIEVESENVPDERTEEMDHRTRKYLESRGLDSKASEEDAWKFLDSLSKEDKAQAEEVPPRVAAEVVDDPRKQVSEITRGLYDQATAAGQTELAFRLLSEGRSDEEIRKAMNEEIRKLRDKPAGAAPETEPVDPLKDIEDDDLARSLKAPQLSFAD